MCGIAGQINFDPARPVDPAALRRMAGAIAHRGPDAEGIWHEGSAGLAHRRLSVIDLSCAANQPMHAAQAGVSIVFNGEIYNFLELRVDLEARGHTFVTQSDTEVLLRLYLEHGVRMLPRLAGMFSFAIWDAPRRRLFAARDRLGKKPFKYFCDGERFIFASELKALRAHPDVRATVCDAAIHEYLSLGYLRAPATGFREIKKLPAAHYLILENGNIKIERYWRVDYRDRTELTHEQAEERIRELLARAVRRRLIADVPVGAFLSGGVDSSAVVAFMARQTPAVRTFSIGFDYEAYNELPAARATAAHFGTQHEEQVVGVRAAALLPQLVELYEEPYADSSALPSWLLAKMTRTHVTVALNGDGGDENFAGYSRYDVLLRALRAADTLGRWRIGWTLHAARALPGTRFAGLRRRAAALRGLSGADAHTVYARIVAKTSRELKAELYREDFARATAGTHNADFTREGFAAAESGSGALDKAMFWDIANYLADELCVKMDLASMAHGLETRSPFLDHELVEFCATLPSAWKRRGGQKKAILKSALREILPAEIMKRPKSGFGIPVHEWFRGELGDLYRETVLASDARLGTYLKPEALQAMLTRHNAAGADEGYRLWMLLTLELWLRGAVR